MARKRRKARLGGVLLLLIEHGVIDQPMSTIVVIARKILKFWFRCVHWSPPKSPDTRSKSGYRCGYQNPVWVSASRNRKLQLAVGDAAQSNSPYEQQSAGHRLSGNKMCFRATLAPNGDGYIDPLAETAKDSHQPVHRETLKIGVADARKIRRRNLRETLGITDGQVTFIENACNFNRQERLELQKLGVWPAKVSKHIAGSSDYFELGGFRFGEGHRICSFSLLIRSLRG
jgi:hypothetical protein